MTTTAGAPEDSDADPNGILAPAREAARVERRRVADEREAFRAFRGRVESISAETVQSANSVDPSKVTRRTGAAGAPGATGAISTGSEPPLGSGLVAVRNAYADTVMSVPHYRDEYDDTYERSTAEEFGPELAYALTRSTGFYAEYQRPLFDAIDDAIDERETLLERVDVEVASLDWTASRLASIRGEIPVLGREVPEGDFGALDACRARAAVLVKNCDRIAARRQHVLAAHARDLRIGDDDVDLPTYLYQDLSVTYPALAAVGTLGDRLDALTRRIERAMARVG
ncbi:hypothetical protein U4E84_12640 [Halorubrum sp. AD140]|uniref:DUF7260 family protein n=1 Tax=Halorubrum sp. AD140 TaxID=3050073 RepID=UPI002ACCB0A4|nr:hypothetical protein [Halorubrum sp. AD140]MDZ5812189.1 hypothetical protein [Halorubrum sp. AD140]